MTNQYRFLLAAGLSAVACISLAQSNMVGVWKGKFSYDYSKLPASLSAEQKKSVIEMSKKRIASTITLTLRSNHTFTMLANGVGTKAQPVTGKWAQDPKTVTLQPIKNGMKDAVVAFNIKNQGKVLTFTNGPLTMTFAQ